MVRQEDVRDESHAALVKWGLDIEEGLTDWEMTFLESMGKRLERGENITSTMREKLEQIIVQKG